MNIKFWKFWTVLVLIIFMMVIGNYYFGLFEFILTYDKTYISFINIAILGIANLLIFKMHLRKDYKAVNHQMIRYLGDTSVALGLIGTLIGFMFVLWSIFGPGIVIDPTNVDSMTQIMATMTQGMSSALITSLTGLITSIIINLQLVFLEE